MKDNQLSEICVNLSLSQEMQHYEFIKLCHVAPKKTSKLLWDTFQSILPF